MAAVHLAHDTVLDRPVAVKTLHTDLGREQSFRERFRREAQAVAKLNHTNIVSVFDSGEDTVDGALVPYIVMEYVEGRPLREVLDEDIARFGAMPTEKALKITADVLAALPRATDGPGPPGHQARQRDAHQARRGQGHGLRHRPRHAVRRHVDDPDRHGGRHPPVPLARTGPGTGRGRALRPVLGRLLLFELLTGRLPFDGDSPLAIAYQHVQEPPPGPSALNRAVQPGVDALVARALRKNPDERFPTADAMRDEVKRVAAPGGGDGTAPLIIGGGPRPRGRGEDVSSAVFPQVRGDMGALPPHAPTPYYAPAPAPAPYPQQGWGAGGRGGGAHTPPAGPAYGYPPSAPHTPHHPAHAQAGHQHATPPYTTGPRTPAGEGRSGGASTTVVALSATVAVIALVVIIIAISAGRMGDAGDAGPAGQPARRLRHRR